MNTRSPTRVSVGETIEIGGEFFVCVEMTKASGKPSVVKFVQPIELLEESERTHFSSGPSIG